MQNGEDSSPINNFLSPCRNDPSITDSNERTDIVELLEAIAYLICQDDPITSNTFHAIMTSKSVSRKMMRLADTNRDEAVSVEELMNFIVYITKVPGLNNMNVVLHLANVTYKDFESNED